MKRSTGVTISAIFVFIGSGVTLAFGLLMIAVAMFVPGQPQQPPLVRYILLFSVALYLALGVWGVASGIGLLRLRQWARISILVFSGILLVFTVPALLILPFIPMPSTAGMPDDFGLIIKVGMGAIYGSIAAIGVGWLYFFNQRTVSDQFRRLSGPGSTEPPFPAAQPSRRPLSITIIGWLLLLGPVFLVPTLLLHLPMLFFGQSLDGWRASLFVLTWCAVQGTAGVGLLKLQPWARILAIATFLFGMLNCLWMTLPGSMSRLEQMNTAMQVRMGLPALAAPPGVLRIGLWMGVVVGVAGMAIQIWFVATRKQAFSALPETPAILP